MTQLRNSTILVTGGASGIGRLMGLLSLQRGAKVLIIWDIDRKSLQAVEKYRILLRKPALVHLIPLLRGLLPTRLFDLLVGRGFRAYSSMKHFTGRQGKKPYPLAKQTLNL